MQNFIYSDHHLLGLVGAQAAGVVERDVAELDQVRPLAQLVPVAADAADLPLVKACTAVGAKDPVWKTRAATESDTGCFI